MNDDSILAIARRYQSHADTKSITLRGEADIIAFARNLLVFHGAETLELTRKNEDLPFADSEGGTPE